ncbi:MAG: hypothetical protein AAGJ79_13605 [Verrucomicrobiota bacterium]
MNYSGIPLLFTLLAFSIGSLSCDRHSWDETKTLVHTSSHDEDHGDGDQGKEGKHGKEEHANDEAKTAGGEKKEDH